MVSRNKYGLPLFDAHKFSLTEIFANNNGKTSSTKLIGFMVSMVCLIIFIMLVIYYFYNPGECANILEIIDRTVSYFSISAGLMGVKSITSSFGKQKIEIMDNTSKPKEDENEEIEVVEK
jgi:hypothetical protein